MEITGHTIKAVIVAAGRGARFGAAMPKQFCDLAGRPLLMTTIERMAEAVGHNNIILVLDATMVDFWLELCSRHSFVSPYIVHGGDSRSQSVANAIESIAHLPADTVVMIHDGARPLATVDYLRRMAVIPAGASGIVPVVPATDSLREKLPDGTTHAVDRKRFLAVQTPQTFTLDILSRVYGGGRAAAILSDDATAVEQAGFPAPVAVDGEPTNIKITNPMDLAIAEAVIAQQLRGR